MQGQEFHGRVAAFTGKGELAAIRVETEHSTAEIYTHGAHVTAFGRKGEPPLLFLSEASEFRADKPIRGGVPVIFPWFGPREGMPMHGHARLAEWDWVATETATDEAVRLRFRLPDDGRCELEFTVTVGASLALEMIVANTGAEDFTFENCLHTYFHVGDIRQVAVRGLQGSRYRDQLTGEEREEAGEAVRFAGEVDRVYQDSGGLVEIEDPALGRIIRVRKRGSRSTVVWNPWIAKSQRMPDFGDDEYLRMVCVESGNVRADAVTLPPGGRSLLLVEIASEPLG